MLVLGCAKKEDPFMLELRLVNEYSQTGLPGVTVEKNGIAVGHTDVHGLFQLSGVVASDSIVFVDADFHAVALISSDHQGLIRSRLYEAQKQWTSRDSAAISFLLSQQNALGILPTVEGGNLVSTYDQSLAAIALMAAGEFDVAIEIFDYFESRRVSELESGLGGFYQFRSASGIPSGNRWMGDNAWLLIALRNYQAASTVNMPTYSSLIASLESWFLSLEDPVDGGLWGGYKANGDTIHKITEGSIDAFAGLLNTGPYAGLRKSILSHLEQDKWDSSEGNLMAWPSNATYKWALDCYTWAYCAFPEYSTAALTEINKFELTVTSQVTGEQITGYCFDEDLDALWFEGTGQVAVMYWSAGEPAAAKLVLAEMKKGWSTTPNGEAGLAYTANSGTAYGSGPLWTVAPTDPCISSTAWYLMASLRHNPTALSFSTPIEAEMMFWN